MEITQEQRTRAAQFVAAWDAEGWHDVASIEVVGLLRELTEDGEQVLTWQQRNPGTCCACGEQMNSVTPEALPICNECYDIINEEDD